jgi:biopolymer transport protein ExbD
MPVQFQSGNSLTSLSLTPLIDVVFLLLIFFLVATRFAEEERELDLPLPDATEAQPLTVEPQEIFVNIDQAGQYVVSGQQVNLDELEQILNRAAANNPVHQSVIIRADKRVPFDFVVQAINLCKKVGIRKYMANTAGP